MGEQRDSTSPVIVFYSYAHEDEPLREQLEKHLRLLSRQGLISEWYDRQIVAGTAWAQEIDEHLEAASIILLLISADFLASDYCYDIEMKRALERHQRREARVIPIILRPCDWQTSPFAHLQCLPPGGKAVTTWQNLDEAFLAITNGLRRVIERQQILARPLSQVERQNYMRLVKRVQTAWIEGVLEHSLHQAALIALDLQEQPDALDNPWRLEVQETNLPPRPLPAGTRITQVYDEAEGELLILGEPGSGKTTLLLELARDLLDRAGQNETHPIPVIFNLSSWAEKQQPLTDWLAEELKLKYQVSPQLAKSWLATDSILPLLDGLDEVDPAHRVDCLKAINAYRGEHDLVSLVVCSRSKEYFSQTTRIRLRMAVALQPLTVQQIDEYLVSAGGQLTALRTVLHHDDVLLSLATTPLMLSVMTLTYHGKPIEALTTTGPPEVRRRQIFAAYVQRMFERRGVVVQYAPEKTIGWLKWLASRMAQHHQTEFYLESMQPDWLWEKRRRQFYDWTVGHPMFNFVWALLHAVYSGLLAVLVVILVSTIAVGISKEVLGALIGIFPVGILISLVSGFLYGWRKGLYIAAIGIPTAALAGALISELTSELNRPMMGLTVGLVTGVMIGLLASIIGWGWKGDEWIYIQSVSGWSWEEVRNSFKGGEYNWSSKRVRVVSVIGVVGIVLVGAAVTVERDIFSGLGMGGATLLAGLLFFVIYAGIQSKSLSKQVLIAPNQGIRLSARNGLYACLAVGLCAFLVPWLIISAIAGLSMGWVCGLIAGVLCGMVYGWFGGWNACARHLVLRVLLWRAGSIPRNYADFLDYAVERIFLRKIGGGYTFIHRQLLEYFALRENETERARLVKPAAKDANIYHNLGEIYAEFGDYDQAIMNYTCAIELDPKEVYVYRDRGLAYTQRKEYQRAIVDYTHAIELDPKNAWTYYQRGSVYRELEEYDKTIADFTRTIELGAIYAYFRRGYAYLWLRKRESACADFVQYAALKPDSINAAWMVIYSNLGKQRPGFDITESLDKIVAINPQSEEAQLCQGVALGLRNSFSDGLAVLERLIQLAKSVHEDAYFWKGLFYAYLGKDTEATQAIMQALEAGLPPVLLTPLYWLEQERPEMYQAVAVPFLVQYGV